MRRRITAAVLAAAMMLSLGACSGGHRTQAAARRGIREAARPAWRT